MTRISPLVIALCMSSTPAFAALSPAESVMVQTVEAEYEQSILLLERLVNQNSGTMNFVGVEAVGNIVRAQLEPLGFTVEWKPMTAAKRSGHVIAKHKGKPGTARLLLIGHLDTVFEEDSPFQRFVREGDQAQGPGVSDDKGGLIVMVAALRAMKAAGTLKSANIEIVLTGDEEKVGDPIQLARADLIAAGERSDIALDFEDLGTENGRDVGSIARRSAGSWTLKTTGIAGHSAGIFSADSGDGAIFEMSRILSQFRAELPEPNLTFNVGLIVGGSEAVLESDEVHATVAGKSNIIPAQATARGDLRTLSDEQTERVKQKMLGIVAANSPGTEATLTFDAGGYPAMPPTEGNRALLAQLNSVNRDLGLPEMMPWDPAKRGAGDISFVAKDVSGLVGLGTVSTGGHSPAETVDLASIKRQAKRAAILMTRLSHRR